MSSCAVGVMVYSRISLVGLVGRLSVLCAPGEIWSGFCSQATRGAGAGGILVPYSIVDVSYFLEIVGSKLSTLGSIFGNLRRQNKFLCVKTPYFPSWECL